jgi:REP element-mobilizing transposase RayT
MPCFLFTYHAYGSWLPDHPDGFVHWKEGRQLPDDNLGGAYRAKMKFPEAEFGELLQRAMIEELRAAAHFQKFRLHAVATEPTHLHSLLSWPDERSPPALNLGVKKSLTIRLKKQVAERTWFSKGGNERQVKKLEHFNYLVNEYLPSHGGWKWDERRGDYR